MFRMDLLSGKHDCGRFFDNSETGAASVGTGGVYQPASTERDYRDREGGNSKRFGFWINQSGDFRNLHRYPVDSRCTVVENAGGNNSEAKAAGSSLGGVLCADNCDPVELECRIIAVYLFYVLRT